MQTGYPGQVRQQGAHPGPQQYGTTFAHLSHPQQYQQAYHDPAYRYRERTRVPLPQAPAWLPVAVFGVGVVAALMVRPAIPESGVEDEDRSGEPRSGNTSDTGAVSVPESTEPVASDSTTGTDEATGAAGSTETEEATGGPGTAETTGSDIGYRTAPGVAAADSRHTVVTETPPSTDAVPSPVNASPEAEEAPEAHGTSAPTQAAETPGSEEVNEINGTDEATKTGSTGAGAFAYGNPDLRIAESHQDLDLATVDTWYLRDLSADAIPGLARLEGNDRDCALAGFQDLVEESDDAGSASWNPSRHRGLQQLDELGLFEIGGQAGMSCSYERGY